jgi:hypothetical protein
MTNTRVLDKEPKFAKGTLIYLGKGNHKDVITSPSSRRRGTGRRDPEKGLRRRCAPRNDDNFMFLNNKIHL